MTMRRTHDLLATVGEYTDREGNKKKNSLNIGTLFTDSETGRMSVKLVAAPGFKTNKDGFPEAWLSVLEIQPRGENKGGYSRGGSGSGGSHRYPAEDRPQNPPPAPDKQDEIEDDIPF